MKQKHLTPNQLRSACDSLYGKGGQTRMAEALGVDGSSVRRWISGASRIPGPVSAAVLCMLERERFEWRDGPMEVEK